MRKLPVVHPQKEKVRFLDKQYIYSNIKDAVERALESQDLTHEKKPLNSVKKAAFVYPEFESVPENSSPTNVFQLHNLFLIKQVADGMVVFDQHAAHERILYEKMAKALNSQIDDYFLCVLDKPYKLDLDLEDTIVLEEHLITLERLGIKIELQESDYVVTQVPNYLQGRNINTVVKEFIDSLNTSGDIQDLDSKTKTALSHLACKLAIKDGEELKPYEITQLLLDLEKTDTPYTCPHGRTAKVFISTNEMIKWFNRA